MHLIKQNYLQIKYESKKGLLLNWNFKDLHQIHNYYHHLMIILAPRHRVSQGLFEQYYKRMKFGDLISFAYLTPARTPKLMNWIEKTQLANLQVPKILDRITKESLSSEEMETLLRFIAQWTAQNSSSNVIANFIFGEQSRGKSEQFVKKIVSMRQDGGFPYHCGLFNIEWFNKISFSNGIHFLNTESRDIFQVLTLYHSIINSAAVRTARIVIDCLNGQMMSYDTQIWQNNDFNRIERTFYGPSINYEQDLIQFHVLDAFDDAEFDMIITLQLVLFSGQLVSSMKRMKLSFQNERHYDKSLNLTNPEPLITFQGIELKSNPFYTSTFVRLMRSNCQDISEIKEKFEQARSKRTRERATADRTTKTEVKEKEKVKRKPLEYFVPNKNNDQSQQFFI